MNEEFLLAQYKALVEAQAAMIRMLGAELEKARNPMITWTTPPHYEPYKITYGPTSTAQSPAPEEMRFWSGDGYKSTSGD